MLVLSRRTHQSIVVGSDIVITVLEVRGDVVRIGITAPRDVDVHREEVFRQLQQASADALAQEPTAVRAVRARRRPGRKPAAGSAAPQPAS